MYKRPRKSVRFREVSVKKEFVVLVDIYSMHLLCVLSIVLAKVAVTLALRLESISHCTKLLRSNAISCWNLFPCYNRGKIRRTIYINLCITCTHSCSRCILFAVACPLLTFYLFREVTVNTNRLRSMQPNIFWM